MTTQTKTKADPNTEELVARQLGERYGVEAHVVLSSAPGDYTFIGEAFIGETTLGVAYAKDGSANSSYLGELAADGSHLTVTWTSIGEVEAHLHNS